MDWLMLFLAAVAIASAVAAGYLSACSEAGKWLTLHEWLGGL